MTRPAATGGLRHVALYVEHFDECEHFYTGLLGMQVEWRPDLDNVYLSSGNDNLALHRASSGFAAEGQHMDHIGFILRKSEDVDAWYAFLNTHNITMKTSPRTHRDNARSFYCSDPDGNTVQMIFHPPIADKC